MIILLYIHISTYHNLLSRAPVKAFPIGVTEGSAAGFGRTATSKMARNSSASSSCVSDIDVFRRINIFQRLNNAQRNKLKPMHKNKLPTP